MGDVYASLLRIKSFKVSMENLSELEMQLKELEPKVREKAMEIARALMTKKKYAEKEAIQDGIKQAKSWFMDLEG